MFSLLLPLASLLSLTAGEENFTCSPRKTFPHPEDCTRYYYCDNQNIQQVFYCSPGYHFNPETDRCDLPDSAPCPFVPSPPSGDLDYFPSLPREESLDSGPSSPVFTGLDPVSSSSAGLDLSGSQSYASSDDLSSGPDYVPRVSNEGPADFSQPSIEDRKDTVEETVLADNTTDDSSGSFGVFLSALQNFEKTLEEGRQKEEDDVSSDFVEVQRRERADETSGTPIDNATSVVEAVGGKKASRKNKHEDNVAEVKSAEEGKSVEGCSANTDFLGRNAPSEAGDSSLTEELEEKSETEGTSTPSEDKTEDKPEEESSKSEDKEGAANHDVIVWPLFPLSNSTIFHEGDGKEEPKNEDYPTVKIIGVEPQNITEGDGIRFNYPIYAVMNVNETSSENVGRSESVGEDHESKSASNDSRPEVVEEIEEAKGTIIFESHTDEKEHENVEKIPDGAEKEVIKETSIL